MEFTQYFCDSCGQRTTSPIPSDWYFITVSKAYQTDNEEQILTFCRECGKNLIERAQQRRVKDIEKVRKDFQKDYLNHPLWFGELVDFI